MSCAVASTSFIAGQEAVSVPQIVRHLEENGGGDALAAVGFEAQTERQGIGLVEAAADTVGRQDIGVGAQEGHGAVAVVFIQPHGVFGAQTVGA